LSPSSGSGRSPVTTKSSSDETDPVLQNVLVQNKTEDTKRVGVEVVQNHGNRVHFGYKLLEASQEHNYPREWPDKPGEYSVVLHVPTDKAYDLITFSTTDPSTDEGQRWERDLKVIYSVKGSGEIMSEIVEITQ